MAFRVPATVPLTGTFGFSHLRASFPTAQFFLGLWTAARPGVEHRSGRGFTVTDPLVVWGCFACFLFAGPAVGQGWLRRGSGGARLRLRRPNVAARGVGRPPPPSPAAGYGQSRFALHRPAALAGKRVLDFGCGCGVAAAPGRPSPTPPPLLTATHHKHGQRTVVFNPNSRTPHPNCASWPGVT